MKTMDLETVMQISRWVDGEKISQVLNKEVLHKTGAHPRTPAALLLAVRQYIRKTEYTVIIKETYDGKTNTLDFEVNP